MKYSVLVMLASAALTAACNECEPMKPPSGIDCGNKPVCGREYYIVDDNSLHDLKGITFIDGSPYIDESAVTSLASLSALKCVSKDMLIYKNEDLGSLAGLESLEWVGDHLWVQVNHHLTDLSALGSLQFVGGAFNIGTNDSLSNPLGLDSLREVAVLIIRYNDALEDLTGLGNLSTVSTLHIASNEQLSSLAGFDSLDTIGSALFVYENSALPTCEATNLRDEFSENGFEGQVCIFGNLQDSCDDDEDDDVCSEL